MKITPSMILRAAKAINSFCGVGDAVRGRPMAQPGSFADILDRADHGAPPGKPDTTNPEGAPQ